MAQRATKLTMMVTMMTMVMGRDDNDGNSTIGDGMMGYDGEDDGDG
jgi:hypothetical protein